MRFGFENNNLNEKTASYKTVDLLDFFLGYSQDAQELIYAYQTDAYEGFCCENKIL